MKTVRIRIRTAVRAGAMNPNHNAKALTIKTHVRAGALLSNHNVR